ncbi:cysteine peptidase family C39 domain-containing protein [Micromonospora sp. KC721]|uniref:cysteine peptidase family C39 domain-containing protein n=1 Tax=Micromonospora sp. KC721 TaxID=2530380 RepID=UPI0014054267|nr:cysteine peptidase family C39 domain-containing protein [Micromonospora sp. KC721]
MRRRLFAPEVVQTSAMDCGPATLTGLLRGFGIRASYARLRDACATDVDGTSIDAMQDAAQLLGLDVQQVMMPVEHLLSEQAEALPAIVVTRQPGGSTHFVVVWRRHGRLLQVMDPAVGRRWVHAERFLADVYVHEMTIPAAAFNRWARSDAMSGPLRCALAWLGIAPADADAMISAAKAVDGWLGFAALDAAVRQVTVEVRGAALPRRAAAAKVRRLVASPRSIADEHWFARAAEDDHVTIRGAVLVRALGVAADQPSADSLPPDLAAALSHTDPAPVRFLRQRLREIGRWRLAGLSTGAALAAVAVLTEAVAFRALLGDDADPAGLIPLLVGLGAVLLALDGFLVTQAMAVGRRLERNLRAGLMRLLPTLPDRYLRSRPLSDLAERAHRMHRLRELPNQTVEAVRLGVYLALLPVVIGLIDARSAVPAALAATVATGVGLLLLPAQAERELRLRSHVGVVARFYLDALVGLVAIRSHRAESVVEREHDRLLGPWAAAVRAVHRTAVTAELAQAGIGIAFVAWLLAGAAGRVSDPADYLLLAYWAVALPAVGQQLGVLARRYPAYRSVTLRLIEPFATTVESTTGPLRAPVTRPADGSGVEVRLTGVRVVAGGQPVLAVDELTVPAGSQVAVVGRSGSGKSTLVGLLLGWHTPAQGEVRVDGAPLDASAMARLRAATAWVDPEVTVWNTSLAANLTYGSACPDTPPGALLSDDVLADVELGPVVETLGAGLAEPLGEGGGLLSGGEAQRVRLGRARLRRGVRLAILDEPFRGLDRGQRGRLLPRARTWWPGATMIFITHDVTDTLDFPRVLVVDDGQIVEDGDPAVLAQKPESTYRGLLDAAEGAEAQLTGPAWTHVRVSRGTVTIMDRSGSPR